MKKQLLWKELFKKTNLSWNMCNEITSIKAENRWLQASQALIILYDVDHSNLDAHTYLRVQVCQTFFRGGRRVRCNNIIHTFLNYTFWPIVTLFYGRKHLFWILGVQVTWLLLNWHKFSLNSQKDCLTFPKNTVIFLNPSALPESFYRLYFLPVLTWCFNSFYWWL